MYPSPGRHLLPSALMSHLGQQPLPGRTADLIGLPRGATLSDLDDSVWVRFPYAKVKRLADAVAQALSYAVTITDLGSTKLFTDPSRAYEYTSERARNALVRRGFVSGDLLTPTTIGELMAIPSFGPLSMLDLLTAVDIEQGRKIANEVGQESYPPQGRFTSMDTQLDLLSFGEKPAVQQRYATLADAIDDLYQWQDVETIVRADPRLGQSLSRLSPTADSVKDAVSRIVESPDVRAIDRITDFIDSLRALTDTSLEDELEQIVSAVLRRPAQVQAVVLRLGLGGAERLTLEQAGQAVGLTRERVRQLEAKVKRALKACERVWAPSLDEAIRALQSVIPSNLQHVEEALAQTGLVKDSFSASSLVEAAALLRDSSLSLADGLITDGETSVPASRIRNTIKRLSTHWGVTTLESVSASLDDEGLTVDSGIIQFVAQSMAGFEWLDDEQNWFWVPTSRNRLLNQVEKIMSVAGTIDLSDLRSGVGRHHRMKGFRPPREVLARFCLATRRYERRGDQIVCGDAVPDWRSVLVGNELLLVETLFEFGPVMRREDLQRIVVGERGLNSASFYIYLSYAPFMERYAVGVFGLRGASTSAAEVQALIPPRARTQVLMDHGWTNDGKIWIVYRLSPAATGTGILGTPAALRSVVQGAFELRAPEDQAIGTLVVEQNMWGLTPFFRRWGAESGDYLAITIDPPNRLATVELGDEDLLFEFQQGDL